MKTTIIAAILITLTIGACAPRMKSVSFLSEDIPFRPDPQDNDVMLYHNPDMKVTSYSKFLIDRVKILNNESFAMTPKEEAAIAENFRKELIGALETGYQVVNKAGPEVLRIRITIQDIQPAEVDFVEEGAVVLRWDTQLAHVSMGLDCVDSLTGERVAALIHSLSGNQYFEKQRKARYLNIQNAFNLWTMSLRKRFDQAKARTNGGFGEPDPEENRKLRFEEGQ